MRLNSIKRFVRPATIAALLLVFFIYSSIQQFSSTEQLRSMIGIKREGGGEMVSGQNLTVESTTTEPTTKSTTATTNAPSTSTSTHRRPFQPIEPARLTELLNKGTRVSTQGKHQGSIVYPGLKNMLGTGDLPIVNDIYNHSMLIVPKDDKECTGDKPLLAVALCYIAPDFFDKRQLIRSTWGSRVNIDPHDFKVIFFVGLSDNKETNKRVLNESLVYNDIVQLNYTDTYHLLTHKVMGTLDWAAAHCPNAQFLVRINDDVVPHRTNLIAHLKKHRDEIGVDPEDRVTNKIIGKLVDWNTLMRDVRHKFYVSKEQYTGHKYFPYIDGSVYILTRDVGKKIRELAKRVYWPPFSVWMEDIYLSFLIHHLQVDLFDDKPRWMDPSCFHNDKSKRCKDSALCMLYADASNYQQAWDLFNS